MTNHTIHFNLPSEIRSSVMAKEVLLQDTATIRKKPAMREMSRVVSGLSGSMFWFCFPNPKVVATVCSRHDRNREIYRRI